MKKKLLLITTALMLAMVSYAENVTLTLYADGCSTSNVITCPAGQQLRVNAVDMHGYHFTQWTDGNTTNPRVVTMNSNATYMAQFTKNLYTITTAANYSARGVVLGDTTVEYLETISISATPNYGYHFTRWNDGYTSNPRQVQVTEDNTYTAQFDKNTYYIIKIANSTFGQVSGKSSALYLDEVTLSATTNYGYHFTQWSDGNTDNPRSFILTQDTTFEAQFAMNYDGKCGDNLYWQYSKGILTITGSGTMYKEMPWILFADSITQVNLPKGLTIIGAGCFQNMSKLNSIVIPASVTSIGANAFAGCRKLYDIYCLAVEPPVAQTSSFENYNVYLHVPCDNLKDYQMDAVLGSFKYIECIGAEETPATDVSVTPSTNSADITWPKNDNASDYSIEIKKDGVVFCTLTFNAQGQLKSIAFAPGRDGGREMPAAVETASGYKFTITGLNPSTTYTYNIDTKNAGGATLANYTGQFTTTSLTALDQLTDSPVDRFTKVIKEGQLYILRDGKTYNALGQEL